MEWYAANNVKVVPKEKNSANTPVLCLIEKYWDIVKQNLIIVNVKRDLSYGGQECVKTWLYINKSYLNEVLSESFNSTVMVSADDMKLSAKLQGLGNRVPFVKR